MKKCERLPVSFYEENRIFLHNHMEDYSAALFFAGEPPPKSGGFCYPFSPNRNFLYLTGVDAPKIVYLAVKQAGITEETLFVERSDPMKEKWLGKTVSPEEATLLSGIKRVLHLDELEDTLKTLFFVPKITNLYLDLDNFDGNYQFHAPLAFYERFRRNYPAVKLIDGGKIVCHKRGVKTDLEIALIKNAIDITALAFEHIINSITPGMYEYQIESCFDFALRYNGVKERAFDTIIAGGKNACVLHYAANNQIVEDGELVLFDFGATCEYYCADITRTVPITGKFTDRQKTLYDIVLDGQRKVLESAKPGITLFELDAILVSHYKRALKKADIIYGRARGTVLNELLQKFYWHKVGHALGLDAHDCAPQRDVPLEPGMVVTIEPGLYLENEKIGIRIEDDILITENGYVNLSESIPKTVEEIEACFAEARAR